MALAAAITFASACHAEAAGNDKGGVPIFAACKPATPPVLPERWRAVGLLIPLLRVQVDVGEFVYDNALPAMRATLTGLESGAIDLLITDKNTYQLTGPKESPSGCVALGPKFKPPSRQWLPRGSVCDGEAAVGPRLAQWWKVPADEGRTRRQWYSASTRLPWRMMFPGRSADPAVIGDYAISYFPDFEPVAQTDLARLRDFCVANTRRPATSSAAALTARELMAGSPDITDAERTRQIQALIPGLSQKACAGTTPPEWPHHFIMTGILTPVLFKWTPLPSMLYYDWKDTATLFAYLHEVRSAPPQLEIVSVLQNQIGYSVERLPNKKFACGAKAPGVVRPNWMASAGCACKAVIDRNPVFGADEVSVIRACPIKNQGLYPMWSWYSTQGRPILFTEPRAVRSGLHIADYHRWMPGAQMPRDAFALPKQCTHAAEAGLPPVGNGLSAKAAESCTACHVTRQ